MTITVQSFIMFLAIVSLVLATIGVQDLKLWRWFPGGMLLWAVSLFLSANIH